VDLKYEIKSWIIEQGLDHPVVQVVENGLHYSAYHPHSHEVISCLKGLED